MENTFEAQLGEGLRSRGWKLAVAESCTGGLLGHRITEVPGSSDYFLGGIIAYSNQVKEALLGVQKRTLEEKGAVSKHTALEMAQGAKRALGAEMGISVTGIAGPTGGTQEKPVGLTWIAVSTPFHERAESYHWNGNRQENKALSAEAALALALKTLEQAHA